MTTHSLSRGAPTRRWLAAVASLAVLLTLAPASPGIAHEDPCPAQLKVEKTAAKDPINRGEEARFIVTVTNVSTNGCTAKNVRVEDNYDTRLNWSTNMPGSCSLGTGQHGEPAINCSAGDLAAGASWSVEIFAQTPENWDCSAIVNRAKVRWTNDARNRGIFPGADVSRIVDQATATIRVQGCEVPDEPPDVEVKKTAAHEEVESGEEARFDIVVVNRGPGEARDVVLTDELPNSGLQWSIGNTPRPECNISGNTLTCTIGTMAVGQIYRITLKATTTDCRLITNTARVSASNEPAENQGNNTATASIQVVGCKEDRPPGGCTPGFWKQSQHFGSWTGYATTDTLQSVFGPNALAGTLLDGLNFGGGPKVDGAKQILLRQAVAALLNSTQGEFEFGLTTSQVISQVQAALATNNRGQILALADVLDAMNNAGCPLGRNP